LVDREQFERALELQRLRAEMAEHAEETQRRLAEHAARRADQEPHMTTEAKPTPIDWSGCRSVAEMTSAQFSAWCDAGKPPLEAPWSSATTEGLHYRVRWNTEPAAPTSASAASGADIFTEDQQEVIAYALHLLRNELRDEFRVEVDKLRHEMIRAEKSGDVIELPRWPRGRDAA
jgi:hypothetical protein